MLEKVDSDFDRVAKAQLYQAAALTALSSGIEAFDSGRERLLLLGPELRARLSIALINYQSFKHRLIFEPAMQCDDSQLAKLAAHMKAECIAAGESYRVHMRTWSFERVAGDWESYKVAARLVASRLKRHLASEAEGVQSLALRLDQADSQASEE